MFDRNGKHGFFDTLFTIGLLHYLSKKCSADPPPAKRKTANTYNTIRHSDKEKNDTRSDAVKCMWMIFGILIMIGGFVIAVWFVKNQLLVMLVLLIALISGTIVMLQGNDKDV